MLEPICQCLCVTWSSQNFLNTNTVYYGLRLIQRNAYRLVLGWFRLAAVKDVLVLLLLQALPDVVYVKTASTDLQPVTYGQLLLTTASLRCSSVCWQRVCSWFWDEAEGAWRAEFETFLPGHRSRTHSSILAGSDQVRSRVSVSEPMPISDLGMLKTLKHKKAVMRCMVLIEIFYLWSCFYLIDCNCALLCHCMKGLRHRSCLLPNYLILIFFHFV